MFRTLEQNGAAERHNHIFKNMMRKVNYLWGEDIMTIVYILNILKDTNFIAFFIAPK